MSILSTVIGFDNSWPFLVAFAGLLRVFTQVKSGGQEKGINWIWGEAKSDVIVFSQKAPKTWKNAKFQIKPW